VETEYAVELKGLAKAFGDVQANRRVDLRVRAGTVHAIVGENGAGKSTAMKILYGMTRPDAGEILIHGKNARFRSPRDAARVGIGMVHQHFMLAGPYSVLDNILLGRERDGREGKGEESGFLRILGAALGALVAPIGRAAARRKLDALSARYGLRADWDARVETLGVGAQQRIEIIKLLYRDASILILDEPTAVLTPLETVELFVQLRRLKAEGKAILIITHKLKEVLDVADDVTVFRAGEVVGSRSVANTTADELATLMIGRKVSLTASRPPPPILGGAVLGVQSLALSMGDTGTKPTLSNVSFEVRSGEVVGIAGVEGNGQSELLALLGRPADFLAEVMKAGGECAGAIRVLGKSTVEDGVPELSDSALKSLGMGVIPEDRHREGLLLGRPVMESYLLGHQRSAPFARHGLISGPALFAAYTQATEAYDIRPRSPLAEARELSGGNQQKVIIARELAPRGGSAPRLLVAAQPTRGVDVGAIEFIHSKILKARSEGAGVLLISSELDEVLALSDRVLVLFEGRIVASFGRGESDERAIGLYMGGGTPT
jgi:general nucleoside transport system ATP-binding protein